MEKEALERLLLKTAFCFMACDGDIDPNEVKLIQELGNNTEVFGNRDINGRLDEMLQTINEIGGQFLVGYFAELNDADLTEQDELKMIKVAIDTINADDKVEYSEIKFFKIFRDKLKIDNDDILTEMPEIEEYLEQDVISPSYIANLTADYLGSFATPTVGSLNALSEEIERAKNNQKS